MICFSKIIKRTLFLSIFYLAVTGHGATELIKNKDLKLIGPTGLPSDFKIRGGGKLEVSDSNGVNVMEVDLKKDERKIISQPFLNLKNGERYQLSLWSKGSNTLKYMFYIEGNYFVGKKRIWESFGNRWRSPTQEWKQFKFEFIYRSKNPKLPYFVIQAKGPGKLEVKSIDLKLCEKETAAINLNKISSKSNGENKVSFNSENILQFNGKPFFPIFLWGTPNFQVDSNFFKEIKRNGINCFYSGLGNGSLNVLDCAHQNGIKVILAVPKKFWTKDITNSYHNVYESLSPEVVNHPALLGYFLGDELLWTNMPLKPILQVYEFLKKIDPNHPVWLNAAPRNSIAALAEYAEACDIYGVDIYPVGSKGHSALEDKSISAVGKYALRMRKAVKDKKPVCMALQGFSWDAQRGKVKKNTQYPTLKQTRFVAYDSIINGATLLSWWGLYSVENPKFYDDLFQVTRELYQITDILTSPKSTSKTICSSKEIEFLVKETPTGKVLIAANTSKQKVTANFTTAINDKKVHVFFEKRQLKINNGVFSDTFEPHAVHIYSSRKSPSVLPQKTNTSCSFREAARKCTTPYSGKANWIWFPGKYRTPHSKCKFSRQFTLEKEPETAILIAVADDYCEIKINEKFVGKTFSWAKAVKIPVVKYLKKGSNVITVTASDAGAAPCGMLFDLRINYSSGKKINIISDAAWKSEDLETKSVKKAQVITAYGGKPWFAKVKTP